MSAWDWDAADAGGTETAMAEGGCLRLLGGLVWLLRADTVRDVAPVVVDRGVGNGLVGTEFA